MAFRRAFFAMKDDTNPAALSLETEPVTDPVISSLDTEQIPDKEAMLHKFESTAGARLLTIRDIERCLERVLSSIAPRPTIKVRTKNFSSYYKKYIRQIKSGINPPVITDLMGIRIICPFIEDLAQVEALIKGHFDVVEVERKGHYTYKEFGYESTHLLIRIPGDIARVRGHAGCEVTEIQVRTILQDAWAEVEHEIFYKAEFSPLDSPMKRKLAAVNASLSLADVIFQEIRSYQKSFHSQLMERRKSFYQKIEESTDAFIIPKTSSQKEHQATTVSVDPDLTSIDDLLLTALTIHNNNQFEDAIAIYSRILELDPGQTICSLIYKHRGMANFAQSKYSEAISDFTKTFELDEKAHIALYYRGVVHSVLQQYPKAIDDFTMSLNINPYQAYCLFRRGQAHYHVGDYPKALSDCDSSLSMEPGNDIIQKFRELIQDKLRM